MADHRDDVGSLFRAALELHQRGRIDEAETLYRCLLAYAPGHADALHLLGLTAHQQGRNEAAITTIHRAVRVHPRSAVFFDNLGVVLSAALRIDVAPLLHRTAILLQPNDPGMYRNFANALKSAGHFHQATPPFAAAVKLSPASADLHEGFGDVLNRQGRSPQAGVCYAKALCLQPANFNAWNNLGVTLVDRGAVRPAIGAYDKAVCLKPDHPGVHNNRGLALQHLGRIDEALAACRTAICLQPDLAIAHNNLGNACCRLGMAAQAAQACSKAIVMHPTYPEAWNNLGNALKDMKQLARAGQAYRTAIAARPDYAEAWSNLGNLMKDQARLHEAQSAYRTALRISPTLVEAHSNLICALHYGDAGQDRILAEARRFGERWPRGATIHPPAERDPGRPLRVGYVSGDFHRHPVGYFVAGILANHDPAMVEPFCYDNGLRSDDLTERLRKTTPRWHRLTGLSDRAASDLIRSHRIDILVDLSGHTAGNRLSLFADKPAPFQVSWLGYWGTTGLPQMDYLISDETTVPFGEEAYYVETVMRLPGCRFCYVPPDYAPSPHLGSAMDSRVTFGSFNNMAKIGPDTLTLWAQILQAVPRSRLLLKWKSLDDEETCRRITHDFAKLGVDATRLTLRGASPHPAMLEEYGDIDIALDPVPFSGGLTSCEALWMGVPVITLAGDTPQSRQTAGILKALGHNDLIAGTRNAYVATASRLADSARRSTQARLELRRQMAESPLCDAATFTRGLEAVYRDISR